ncbi:hypothetical protein IMZ48_03270 [Candidatus Bathyarchaeota archaeon]|nr:hypothetical protein [Candidatus Bathyarchaeota archaeon]
MAQLICLAESCGSSRLSASGKEVSWIVDVSCQSLPVEGYSAHAQTPRPSTKYIGSS